MYSCFVRGSEIESELALKNEAQTVPRASRSSMQESCPPHEELQDERPISSLESLQTKWVFKNGTPESDISLSSALGQGSEDKLISFIIHWV